MKEIRFVASFELQDRNDYPSTHIEFWARNGQALHNEAWKAAKENHGISPDKYDLYQITFNDPTMEELL
jgi:hypothetical protein